MRNITTDQFAGVAAGRDRGPAAAARSPAPVVDVPSGVRLPAAQVQDRDQRRSAEDRAAIAVHDIGLYLRTNAAGETAASRSWSAAAWAARRSSARSSATFLPWQHLLTYLEAILRVYNRYGRRDNKYKARIKILVKALGVRGVRAPGRGRMGSTCKDGPCNAHAGRDRPRVAATSPPPAYEKLADTDAALEKHLLEDNRAFARWVEPQRAAAQGAGLCAVTLVAEARPASPPGDATDKQMDAVADLADALQLRRTARDARAEPGAAGREASATCSRCGRKRAGAGSGDGQHRPADRHHRLPGRRLLLAGQCASSIPIALAIQERFDDLDFVHDLGEISLNISGCINACGHHHVGNIGVLGVDKDGAEWYQVTLGGAQGNSDRAWARSSARRSAPRKCPTW